MERKILKGKEIQRSLLGLDGLTFAEAIVMLADQGVDIQVSALKSQLEHIGYEYVTFDDTYITVTNAELFVAAFTPEIEKTTKRQFSNPNPVVSNVTLARRRAAQDSDTFHSNLRKGFGTNGGFRD